MSGRCEQRSHGCQLAGVIGTSVCSVHPACHCRTSPRLSSRRTARLMSAERPAGASASSEMSASRRPRSSSNTRSSVAERRPRWNSSITRSSEANVRRPSTSPPVGRTSAAHGPGLSAGSANQFTVISSLWGADVGGQRATARWSADPRRAFSASAQPASTQVTGDEEWPRDARADERDQDPSRNEHDERQPRSDARHAWEYDHTCADGSADPLTRTAH
jgi:hypothetical protein